MRSITPVAAAIIPFLAACGGRPVEDVPLTDSVVHPSLSGPVDVVRDTQGIPHIYGERMRDVAFAQGYVMAQDRLVQMDLARRQATGTLSELAGVLSESLIDSDIQMRVHHMRKSADQAWEIMRASQSPDDALLVDVLERFAEGVNTYVKELQDNKWSLPPQLILTYNPQTFVPWRPSDSLVIGLLIAFNLSYDADADIARTTIDKAAAMIFDNGGTPELLARRGLARDLLDLRPADPTYTWPGGLSAIPNDHGPLPQSTMATSLALLRSSRKAILGLGIDRREDVSAGSNNWVVSSALSATGHPLLANDPHLALRNPATFHFNHVVARGGEQPIDVFGAQFPGAPGVILGFNRHVAWGGTVSGLDVTDAYDEEIVTCDGSTAPCVMFKGGKVPLVPREEVIKVGRFGEIVREVKVTLWDVPHHGPILPRIGMGHTLEPLASRELSVRWTGYEPTFLVRAVLGLNRARSVAEANRALIDHFSVGGQNWVLADDSDHIGWTEAVRVPKRPAGTRPWFVLPGDGSAEWGADLDHRYIPHAFDPPSGFLATANQDPIGVTDSGDPLAGAPLVDGAPLYIGADFDAGTRMGRITKRLTQAAQSGRKIDVREMQSIQADVVSEWIEMLAPTMKDAAQAILEEMAQPGTHPDLTAAVRVASPLSKGLVQSVVDRMKNWNYSLEEESVAATVSSVWVNRFALNVLEDELEVLGEGIGTQQQLKLLVRLCNAPQTLQTRDVLFDDLNTPGVIEGKRFMAARALFDMLDYLIPALGQDLSTWKWSRLHTIALDGLLPLDSLRVPLKSEPGLTEGFPRHGGNGTVDVAAHGMSVDDFTYGSGPVIRVVYALDPKGPQVKNALPGGQVFDPLSPHYRDLMELWRKNETFDVAYAEADVAAAALVEKDVNGTGRVRFRAP